MRRKWPGWVGSVSILFGSTNVGLGANAVQNAFYYSNWSCYAATGNAFTDV